MWKIFTVLEHARANPFSDLAIITLDVEKAFDSISFHWLRLVLQSFSFSGYFLHLISTMYSEPSANEIAAGHISNSIPLHKGIRQGCPLSPLLFNLALEPLSCYLLLHSCLHRVVVGHHELHTALFSLFSLYSPHSGDIHPV